MIYISLSIAMKFKYTHFKGAKYITRRNIYMLKTFGKFINGLLGKKDDVVVPEAPYKVPEPVAPMPPVIVEPVVVALKEVAKKKAVKEKPTTTPVVKKPKAKAAAMKVAPVAVPVVKPKTARKPKAAK